MIPPTLNIIQCSHWRPGNQCMLRGSRVSSSVCLLTCKDAPPEIIKRRRGCVIQNPKSKIQNQPPPPPPRLQRIQAPPRWSPDLIGHPFTKTCESCDESFRVYRDGTPHCVLLGGCLSNRFIELAIRGVKACPKHHHHQGAGLAACAVAAGA